MTNQTETRELTEEREGFQRVELSDGTTVTLLVRWLENAPGTDSDLIEHIERWIAAKRPEGTNWRSIEQVTI